MDIARAGVWLLVHVGRHFLAVRWDHLEHSIITLMEVLAQVS